MSENHEKNELFEKLDAFRSELEEQYAKFAASAEEKLQDLDLEAQEGLHEIQQKLIEEAEDLRAAAENRVVEVKESFGELAEDASKKEADLFEAAQEELFGLAADMEHSYDNCIAFIKGEEVKACCCEDESCDCDQDDCDCEEGACECASHKKACKFDCSDFLNKKFTGKQLLLGIAATALVFIIATFVGHGCAANHTGLGAELDESQLSKPVASYTFNGKKLEVTAEDILLQRGSLEEFRNDKGMYQAPSAESILDYIRQNALIEDAKAQGLSVSDEELKDFAREQLGNDDLEAIAKTFGVEKAEAEEILRNNLLIKKLSEKVMPPAEDIDIPEAPAELAEGAADEPTEEYAQYIITLAGPSWNADAQAWAGMSPYQQILSDFDGKTATHEQAEQAFRIAIQMLSEQQSENQKVWQEYVGQLFGKISVKIYGLYS